ncbi:MAG: hypothetical protein ACFFCE_08640 [Promethearchaeota archaeon]
MPFTQKLSITRIILILIFFFASIPITLICALLGDATILISITKGYFTSGNSIFLPYLSITNIFWFLPDKFQFIQISSGFLIDSIIIINICPMVERIAYQYYIKVCSEEVFQEPFDFDPKNQIHNLHQGSVILFGLGDEPILPSNVLILSIKFKKNESLINKCNNYYFLKEKGNKFDEITSIRLFHLSFILHYSHFLQFFNIYDIEKLDSISINQYLYPQTIISYSTKPFQREG